MRVLGIHIGHDASACLVENGQVVRYIQEERFAKIKSVMTCPINSIQFALGEYTIDDVDAITMAAGIPPSVMPNFTGLCNNRSNHVPVYLRDKLWDIEKESINQLPHHLCHAASAYYTSGFKDSLIITVDGIGETVTQTVSIGKNGKIEPLYMIAQDGIFKPVNGELRKVKQFEAHVYSWGFFYGMITEALGWRTFEGEGKVMGLAPYGKYHPDLYQKIKSNMYSWKEIGYWGIAGVSHHHYDKTDYFVDLIKQYGREDVAFNAQLILEERILKFARYWMKASAQTNLCLAGGTFLNVKVNQRLSEEFNTWAFPLANDAGLCVGSALAAYYQSHEYKPKRIDHIYWGDEWTDKQIETVLLRNKLKFTTYDVKKTAKLLADNKIIARFVGRMEAGPRALGNRSILMSPLKPENKDIINRDVKFREPFRPFCPSVIAEKASKYFDGDGEFMITACKVRTTDIPAVTHVDQTARPQVVRKEVNKPYHDLIKEFGKLTCHPVLLNTSLNIRGEPIIRTPEDAIRCLYGTGLDGLIIGKYFILKEGA